VLGLAAAEQRASRLDGDVGGQGEERHRDDPQRGAFAALVVCHGELPRHRSGRGHLDDGVEPEADQRCG
jgi:hypothetical protein